MQCVSKCPSSPDFYGYDHATLGGLCVLYCPASNYKYLPSRMCVTSCLSPYFKDSTTMKCV